MSLQKRAKRNARITQGRLHALLSYDPDTGVFINRVSRGNRALAGAVFGSKDSDGYLQGCLDWRTYKLHQLAFVYMTGRWPDGVVDHIDTCRANNRWANLREVTASMNSQNMRSARCDSATGLLGASFDKSRNKYLAQILIDGVKKNLGRFDTAEQAHRAYVEAKRKHHKGNTL